MAATEISVKPELVFAELQTVLARLKNLPEPGEVGSTLGASASDSIAARELRTSLNDLGTQLTQTVQDTAQKLFNLADAIREAVESQLELDASFADEAKAITGMLDSLEADFPGIVTTSTSSGPDAGAPRGRTAR